MALPATAVIEVRTTGSDTQCGGGFNAARGGNDYSQQNTAQATGTVTSATTTVTATTGIFTSVMVGNYITDGTTFKEITAFTSSLIVTVDSAPSWTAATIYVGGALLSLGKAASILVNGNIIFQKAGTYSISTATVNVAGGTLSNALNFIACGYSTTRTLANTDTKPVNQYGASTITMTATRGIYVNVEFDGNAQTAARLTISNDTFLRCMIRNMNTASSTGQFVACQATTNSASVFTGSCSLCEAFANTATPFTAISVVDCMSYGNTGATTDGFALSSVGSSCVNCVSYGNGRDGFSLTGATRSNQCVNCHAENNAQYGFNVAAVNGQLVLNCSTYNNIIGTVNSTGVIYNAGSIAVTAGSVFTNAAGNDFSLNNTANQGALLRAAGFPATFPRGTTSNYRDIGAAQHQDPAAGGANLLGNGTLVIA